MATQKDNRAKAQIDFSCLADDCDEIIKFDLVDVTAKNFVAVCEKCHNSYSIDGDLRDKLQRMHNLISAIRQAEDILGDANVSVNVAGGDVKVPYALLLTRLNTLITLNLNGRQVDFHLWIEPSSPDTFR